jgi:hypothetical protein
MPGLVTVIPAGNIGGIEVDATIEEIHSNSLQVTEHPVEAGALITDHSFKRPVGLVMRCGWSNSSAAAFNATLTALFSGGAVALSDYVSGVYSQLLALQETRAVFAVMTSICMYQNMLMTDVQLLRDQKTSQALMVTVTFRSVILVSTQSTTLPATAVQKDPASSAEVLNNGTQQLQPGTPAPGGAVPPQMWVQEVTARVMSPNEVIP